MILDRFFKPKWQHPDPQLRKQALLELADGDPVLIQMVRQDRSADVRCAALLRITEPQLLQQIASQDSDSAVRESAVARYRALLAGTAHDAPALAQRLAVLTDLAGDLVEFLACHGQEPELRLAALARIEQENLLSDIAVNDPAVQVRLAALERVVSLPALENVVRLSRSRDKRIYRQAQERLEVLQAEQQRAQRLQALCVEMEQLDWDSETGANAARFPRLEREWQELAGEATLAQRERYRRAHARFQEQRQAALARRNARLQVCNDLEQWLAVLNQAVELEPSLTAMLHERLPQAEQDWAACGPVDDLEGRRLEQRFGEIVQALRDRERVLHRNQERATRLRTVLQQADQRLKQSGEVLEQDLRTLQQQWTGLERPEDSGLANRLQHEFDTLMNRLRARLQKQVVQKEQEWQDLQHLLGALEQALEAGELQHALSLHDQARQRLQQAIGLSRKQVAQVEERLHSWAPRLQELRGWRRWGTQQAREHLCEQAEQLIGSAAEPPEIAQQVKTLRNTWKTLDGTEGAAPRALWKRFDRACERAYEPCQAYFEAQTRERQHNLARKQALCERLEQWVESTDWTQADWRGLDHHWRDVQKEWRKLGPVNRADQKTLERRFEGALRRLDEHLRGERERELQRRRDLVERVRQLAGGDDLVAAVEAAKQAQARWQPTVQASRREEQTLWRQFRTVCDKVFERRQAAQAAAEAERQQQLERKTALCEALEALAAGEEELTLAQANRRIHEVQAEWAAVGPLPRGTQKSLEQRFEAASEQLRQRAQTLRQRRARRELDNLRQRAALCAELEAQVWFEEPVAAEQRVAEAQQQWDSLAPPPVALAEPLQRRFAAACQALLAGGDVRRLFIQALEHHLPDKEQLCLRLEVLSGVESPPEFAQARMAYQVARLSASLSQRDAVKGGGDAAAEARHLAEEWCLSGVLPPTRAQALEARFERALAALS